MLAGVEAFFGFVQERRGAWRIMFRNADDPDVAVRLDRLRDEVAAAIVQLMSEEAERKGLDFPKLPQMVEMIAQQMVGSDAVSGGLVGSPPEGAEGGGRPGGDGFRLDRTGAGQPGAALVGLASGPARCGTGGFAFTTERQHREGRQRSEGEIRVVGWPVPRRMPGSRGSGKSRSRPASDRGCRSAGPGGPARPRRSRAGRAGKDRPPSGRGRSPPRGWSSLRRAGRARKPQGEADDHQQGRGCRRRRWIRPATSRITVESPNSPKARPPPRRPTSRSR